MAALASDTTVADTEVRDRLRSLVAEHQQRKPPTRAQLVHDHLTLEIRHVRSQLSALVTFFVRQSDISIQQMFPWLRRRA